MWFIIFLYLVSSYPASVTGHRGNPGHDSPASPSLQHCTRNYILFLDL